MVRLSFDDAEKNFLMDESNCAAGDGMWLNEDGEAGHVPDFHVLRKSSMCPDPPSSSLVPMNS